MWKVHGMRDYRHGNLAYLSISGVPFRDFKEGNIYYVDKTMLIADILGDRSRNVYIYVRPRRFGKSTNLSMLDAFFNLKYEGNDCFDGLEMSKHHEFDGHRNTHPVIRMNLKDILTDTFDNFVGAMTAEIHHAFKAHHELFQTDATTPDEKRLYESLGLNSVPQSLLVNSLKTLSEILFRTYEGRKVVVLIDEYDHPVTEAFDTDSLRPITQFLGKILSATLKDKGCIELAYITGITRIAKEGMFSGLNGVVVNDVFSERSGERFGFTEREVRDMLEYYGHPEKFDEVREWYDGYRFGDSEVYNTFSVLNYVYHGFEPDGYWAMSGSDEPLIWMMTRLRYRNFPLISDIVRGVPTRSEVIRSMTYDDILEAMGNGEGGTEMLSLMVMAGYLKAIPDGTFVHNIELKPGKGAQMCRAAGTSAQVLGSEGNYVTIRLASSEVRKVLNTCRATIGVVGNEDYNLVNIGKAGKSRHLGIRPTVRGFVMNPVDHPHGGGEGKCPVGRDAPRTPWGKKAMGVKTRRMKKNSTRLIVRRKNG